MFIEFVTILLPLDALFFGPKACGIFAPWPGIEPVTPALEDEVLTTGALGRSLAWFWMKPNYASV